MTDLSKLPSSQARIDSLEMRGISKRFPSVLAQFVTFPFDTEAD
jgi:hypothetical protein